MNSKLHTHHINKNLEAFGIISPQEGGVKQHWDKRLRKNIP